MLVALLFMSESAAVSVSLARVSPPLRSLCLLLLIALAAFPHHDAQAQSRREREFDAFKMRMAAAEGRYVEALVKVGNNNPAGLPDSNAALEVMEDVLAACVKLKGCPMSQLLTTYKRLLKGGHTLTLIQMTPKIRNVFRYAGLDRVLEIQ